MKKDLNYYLEKVNGSLKDAIGGLDKDDLAELVFDTYSKNEIRDWKDSDDWKSLNSDQQVEHIMSELTKKTADELSNKLEKRIDKYDPQIW